MTYLVVQRPGCLIEMLIRLTKVSILYVGHLRRLRRFPPFFLTKIAKVANPKLDTLGVFDSRQTHRPLSPIPPSLHASTRSNSFGSANGEPTETRLLCLSLDFLLVFLASLTKHFYQELLCFL